MTKNNLHRTIEIILSLLIFLGIWTGLSANSGGPIYSDELLYIEMGLNNQQVANYGNRYFHVYLQKAFMSLAPTPLQGLRIYWAFLIALTALLVYWSARLFFKDNTIIHGLVAAALFFSYHMISDYAGVPSVDITAMMMTTAYLFVYVLYQRTEKKWLIYLLGALSFLSFKTKETTLFANVVLFGFFFDDEGTFAFKNIVPYLKGLIYGFLCGIGLFIILDTAILGKPFFAISPSTFREVFQNYAYTGGFRMEPVSWYQTYLLDDIMIPFLFFIFSGIILNARIDSPQKKIVWLFPLILVSFITLNMLKIPWGFIERFYFPALPVIAFLAPQGLFHNKPVDKKTTLQLAAVVILALLAVLGMRQAGMAYVEGIGWNYGKYLESIYFPVLLSLMIILLVFVKKHNLITFGFFLFFLVSWSFPQITYNYKYIYSEPITGMKYETKYYPLLVFKEDIPASNDVKMFTTTTIYENSQVETKMLSNNPYDILGMYNMLFDMRTGRDNLTLAYQQEDIAGQILAQPYDFILLSMDDWQYLQMNAGDTTASLEDRYTIQLDLQETLVLLTAQK